MVQALDVAAIIRRFTAGLFKFFNTKRHYPKCRIAVDPLVYGTDIFYQRVLRRLRCLAPVQSRQCPIKREGRIKSGMVASLPI